ncbi:hypothetical protein, partial [Azospirillum sp. B506]|uniref:hypothetical protein n=1 Tax=Azospirillum sp. B506 TaxID=137721 RepID=UPI0027D8EFED
MRARGGTRFSTSSSRRFSCAARSMVGWTAHKSIGLGCTGEQRVPTPNDGRDLTNPKAYKSHFTAIDGDTMKIAWQVWVDGNLDNTDADYQ